MEIKKDLTSAIEDGLLKGFWKPILCFIVGVFIFEFIFIGLMFYGNYNENNCSKDGTCPITTVASQSCFPLENLNCHVLIGNETQKSNTGYFSICGYQEANAFYEQIKPEIEDWLQNDNPSWDIKRLKCD